METVRVRIDHLPQNRDGRRGVLTEKIKMVNKEKKTSGKKTEREHLPGARCIDISWHALIFILKCRMLAISSSSHSKPYPKKAC